MNKDVSIQLLRIFSMVLIILCHLCIETGIPYIVNAAQFFNVGVFIFLFISGYLYGRKKDIEPKDFFVKRFKKLMIPFYLFLIYIILLNFVTKNFNILHLISNLFNIQYYFGSLNGMEHLWFMTELMICYCITPYLFKIKNMISNNNKKYLLFIFLICVSIVCSFISTIAVNTILYFLVYLLGFYYVDSSNKKNNLFYICIMLIAILIRIISKNYLDNSILYNSYIVFLTHTMLTISLFNIFRNNFNKIKSNSIIDWIDNISFYVYICHYQFIYGPISVIIKDNIISLVLTSSLSIILSILFAIILKKISGFVLKNVN